MVTSRNLFVIAMVVGIAAANCATSWGVIIFNLQTTPGNTSPMTPSVSTDLLQTSLSSVNPVGGDGFLTGTFKYNGTTGTAHESSVTNPANVNSAGTYDFFLNTTLNPLGYDITAINTYTGWTDFRAGQDQTVWISLVGSPAFTQIADYNIAHSDGTLRTSITDSTGKIASGVDAIRFIVDQSTFVYREVDVLGNATAAVPEPASIAIWSLVGLGLAGFGYHRCRRKQ